MADSMLALWSDLSALWLVLLALLYSFRCSFILVRKVLPIWLYSKWRCHLHVLLCRYRTFLEIRRDTWANSNLPVRKQGRKQLYTQTATGSAHHSKRNSRWMIANIIGRQWFVILIVKNISFYKLEYEILYRNSKLLCLPTRHFLRIHFGNACAMHITFGEVSNC